MFAEFLPAVKDAMLQRAQAQQKALDPRVDTQFEKMGKVFPRIIKLFGALSNRPKVDPELEPALEDFTNTVEQEVAVNTANALHRAADKTNHIHTSEVLQKAADDVIKGKSPFSPAPKPQTFRSRVEKPVEVAKTPIVQSKPSFSAPIRLSFGSPIISPKTSGGAPFKIPVVIKPAVAPTKSVAPVSFSVPGIKQVKSTAAPVAVVNPAITYNTIDTPSPISPFVNLGPVAGPSAAPRDAHVRPDGVIHYNLPGGGFFYATGFTG